MTTRLINHRILLIISGGIAAYKSLDLIRRLKNEGAQVRAILTDGGAQFITPLSVTALTGEPCLTQLFAPEDEKQFGHIRLSRESDLIVVAPATADMMAQMAHGLAGSLASAVLLATDKPVMIAPAMNSRMWQHPATQANLATLSGRGVLQVGPGSGCLACGEEGAGRMSEPEEILGAIVAFFAPQSRLAGKHFIVTSGPTFEPIDPVRFLGNRSSGKQGHAIAAALAHLGARVTLVSGPTALPDPEHVTTHRVQTAREMMATCQSALPADGVICAAAVADWRADVTADQKIKKDGVAPVLTLTENPDILATLSQPGPNRSRLVVGFAAETDALAEHAQAKFVRKGSDWLLANNVANGQTFGEDENEVILFQRTSDASIAQETWSRARKNDIAQKLAERIAAFFENTK